MPSYQGPVRPGSDEQTFRDTGSSRIVRPVAGPTRPSDNTNTFRSGGGSTGGSSNRSSGSSNNNRAGGSSRVNPITGQGEYQLDNGSVVPITPSTTKSISQGDMPSQTLSKSILAGDSNNYYMSGGLGGGGTYNPTASEKTTATGYGTFVYGSGEDIGRDVGYKMSSTAGSSAIREGGFLGETPIYSRDRSTFEGNVFGTTQAQREMAFSSDFPTLYGSRGVKARMDASDAFDIKSTKLITDFQSSPESFIGKEGVIAQSTMDGTKVTLLPSFFESTTEYKNLVGIYGSRSESERMSDITLARNSFSNLSPGQQFKTLLGTGAMIGEKFSAGAIEGGFTIGGSALKTLSKGSFGSGTYTSEQALGGSIKPFSIEIYKPEFFGKYSNDVKAIPTSEQSYFSTKTVPFVGIEYPSKLSDVGGYLKELPSRRGAFLSQSVNMGANVFLAKSLATSGIKAFGEGKAIYMAERGAGASRLGAFDVVGGEAISSISPLKINQRIFAADATMLKPYASTQINKGGLIENIKIGETGLGEPLITSKGKQLTYEPSKIDYISYKPKLSNSEFIEKSIDVSKFSQVTLKDNVFKLSPTQNEDVFKISGYGTREVVSGGYMPFQLSRYELGTKMFGNVEIQSFKSTGKAFKASGKDEFLFSFKNQPFLKTLGEPKVKTAKLKPGLYGDYSSFDNTIRLNKNLGKQNRIDTYFHERGHRNIANLYSDPRMMKALNQRKTKAQNKENDLLIKDLNKMGKAMDLKGIGYSKEEIPEEALVRLYEKVYRIPYSNKPGNAGKSMTFDEAFSVKSKGTSFEQKYPYASKYAKDLFKSEFFKEPHQNIVKAQLKGKDTATFKGSVIVSKSPQFDISIGKSTFKPIERYSFIEGQGVTRSGKAFGNSIFGRSSVGRGLDIYKKTGEISSDLGKIEFGKSFGKQSGGGRRMVTQFDIKSVTPNKNGITISSGGNSITPKDYGIKVTKLYSKGEFDYLSTKQVETNKAFGGSIRSTLSQPKISTPRSFGSQKTITQTKQFNIGTSYGSKNTNGMLIKETSLVKPLASATFLQGNSFSSLNSLGLKNSFAYRSGTLSSSALAMSQIQPQAQSTKQFEINVRPQSFFTPGGGRGGFNFTPPTSSTGFGFFLPSMSFQDSFNLGGRKGKQKKRRTPSFVSLALGRTTSKANPYEISGLVARDIITGRKKKR